MTRIASRLMAITAVVLAVLGGTAISAQDKYTVQVPGGLAFSEFTGYEGWQAVAISHAGRVALILANPVMIDAYQAGIPANGKPLPDGAKLARIHGSRNKARRLPHRPRCRARCMTWTSW